VGVDLAPKMLAEAKALAIERGLHDRTRYLDGDFIDLYDQIEPVNITLLDKVVCCYPDADTLVNKSLDKTNRIYAVTYPRDRWFVRLGVELTAFLLCLLRSGFRSYVHNPKTIEAWILQRGFVKRFQEQTVCWLTQVYERA
jgi:magnesium-protoporphyrin O-methyltransferase